MKNIKQEMTILSTKANPTFYDIVVNRVWKQWWEAKGETEHVLAEGLRRAFAGEPFYDAFVAVDKGAYLGSAMVIKSDMEERPNFGPWVAGVFVEPQYRGQGIGAALVAHAAQNAFQHDVATVYLCATKKNSAYYDMLGWKKLEEDVGEAVMTIFIKTPSDNLACD